MKRLCPDCKKPLPPLNYGGVTLDTCGMCGGIWFDEGEMGRILREGPIALVKIEEEVIPELKAAPGSLSGRACPDCLEPLYKYHYCLNSPIELDGCAICGGFWVEDGELDKIQDWVVHGESRLKASERDRAELALELANAQIDHDRFMRRSESIRTFFSLIDLRPGQRFNFTRRY
jgi:Zn-finger nucleic acid-binding protein